MNVLNFEKKHVKEAMGIALANYNDERQYVKELPQVCEEEYGTNYQTKHKPCDFLQEDGNCKLGDCKPDSCKKYPYTDQPERLSSLLSILDTIEICPVAFEIFEGLKQEYGFRTRREII